MKSAYTVRKTKNVGFGLLPTGGEPMRGLVWMVAVLFVFAASVHAEPPKSDDAAKRLLSDIHEEIGHLVTLYCGCPYERARNTSGDINSEPCGHETRTDKTRSGKVEWEHVTPAAWFGAHRSCWKGDDQCVRQGGKDKGKPYGSRECCKKSGVDPEFRLAYADPHNLFPADGELNNDRKDYSYGTVAGETRHYGACDFEVAGSSKIVEPDERVRGELARAMLYMADKHGARLRMPHYKLLRWHEADPPEEWERRRAHYIEAKTGLRNPYIGPPYASGVSDHPSSY